MQEDDAVILKPRTSKADSDGKFWCSKPIFLPYRKYDPVCAARKLVEYELMDPVNGPKRHEIPLFAADKGVPFTKSQVSGAFKAQLRLVCTNSDCKMYSFHSYRIYLATMLDQAKCPPDKIKRMLRWISDEALMTYVRDDESAYKGWLDAVASCTVNTRQVANMPTVAAAIDMVDFNSDYGSDLDDS